MAAGRRFSKSGAPHRFKPVAPILTCGQTVMPRISGAQIADALTKHFQKPRLRLLYDGKTEKQEELHRRQTGR